MPVLSLYPMPAPLELCDWEMKLTDTTGKTTVIRWEDLQRLPKVQEPTPLVCQIFNWSETPEVTGVRLNTVLEAAGLNASSAGYLAFYSADGMPHELFNAVPYGEEFTQIFLGNREYTDLPRKLNVTITGCLENCTHSETQDIAMTPAIGPKGVYGFNVAVGGQLYDELAKSMLMMVIEDQLGGRGGADHPLTSGVHRFPRRRQDVRIGRRCCLHLADRAKRPLKAAESDAWIPGRGPLMTSYSSCGCPQISQSPGHRQSATPC